jgi:PKD repeat protein
VASFNAGSVCLGEPVQFNNTSAGATSYLWDFGDGSATSSLQNPTHTYTVGNTYTILLIASDGICSDTVSQTVTVNPPPNVSFTANVTSGCDSLTVTFTNSTTGATSYTWDFGDGFGSGDVNPVHTFSTPGIYSVTLNGILGICISSQTSVNLISIHETPQTTVTVSDNVICPGECVNYTSTSTGSPNQWAWNFPGSSTTISSAENPQNICYGTAGVYNVFLNVSNGFCSSSQSLTGFITVNPCTSLVAGFYSSDTVLCKGSCINFISTAQNATSHQWSFPGATPASSTQQNPTNICYPTSGNYDVTLIVSDGNDFDTLTITSYIQVAVPPTPPVFTQNGDTLLSSAAASYQWYLNGMPVAGATNQMHVAQASGMYSVSITDANGCSATSQQSWVSLIGIQEVEEATLVYLYPNPAYDKVTLLIESDVRLDVKFQLHDALGKQMTAGELDVAQSPFRKEFDLSALSSGIYFISIEYGDFRQVRKIIKQ